MPEVKGSVMSISAITAWVVANPAAATFIGGAALQGASWLVKKSPWLWDDTLLGWAVKNKAGLSVAAKAIRKKGSA